MSEKRRVFGTRIDLEKNNGGSSADNTPTRTARASPGTVIGFGGRAKVVTTTSSNSNPSTPTAGSSHVSYISRTAHVVGSGGSTNSPSSGARKHPVTTINNTSTTTPTASNVVKARVLGYSTNGNTASPTYARTPPASNLSNGYSSSPSVNNNLPASVTMRSLDTRVRAASTEPASTSESPTCTTVSSSGWAYSTVGAGRTVSPKRKAIPFPSSSSASDISSNSATPTGAHVRPGLRKQVSRADPLKQSMTSRPVSAIGLLPSPKIAPSSSSTQTPKDSTASTSSAVFSPSTSSPFSSLHSPATFSPGASTARRPPSPIRTTTGVATARSTSPTRPFRPTSPGKQPLSPLRSTASYFPPSSCSNQGAITSGSASGSVNFPSRSLASSKRPSTSSQSSYSISPASSPCFSPAPIFSDTSATTANTSVAGSDSLKALDTESGVQSQPRRRAESQSSDSSLSSSSSGLEIHSTASARLKGIGITFPADSNGAEQDNLLEPAKQAMPFKSSLSQSMMVSPLLGSSPSMDLSEHLQQVKLEAKVNRKILDLEITNASLLAINSTLEQAKLKQANEIRELRRRLRDGSLSPLTTLSPNGYTSASDQPATIPQIGVDVQDQEDEAWEDILQQDSQFAEIVRVLEHLNKRGNDALSKTVTHEIASVGGKVINQFGLTGLQPTLGSVPFASTATNSVIQTVAAAFDLGNESQTTSEGNSTFLTEDGLETEDDDETDEGTTQEFSRSISVETGIGTEMSID